MTIVDGGWRRDVGGRKREKVGEQKLWRGGGGKGRAPGGRTGHRSPLSVLGHRSSLPPKCAKDNNVAEASAVASSCCTL